MRSTILAHNIGHHIEKLANDGQEGWGLPASEVIAEMEKLAGLLEKLCKEEKFDDAEVSYLKKLGLYEEQVIVPKSLIPNAVQYVLNAIDHYFELAEEEGEVFDPRDYTETISLILNGKPINDAMYADQIIDHFNL